MNKTLSNVQKEYLKNGCPECGSELYEVGGDEDMEQYLWCRNCDVSIDSSGGYTN